MFESAFGDWMTPGTLCLIAGMAGSRQGWREALYCACPAGFADIATHLEWVEQGHIAIVPGLSIVKRGVPDVMRGEETQVFGALPLLDLADARLVLPGTHSKWVNVTARHITDFSTWMTGEFYALLRYHSILARTLAAEDTEHDAGAFDLSVEHALHSQGLLHTAFSVRTLSLFERMPAGALPSYLGTVVMPVGGITPGNMRAYLAAGADGFGIGSALYKPGMSAGEVVENAMTFIAACAGHIRA